MGAFRERVEATTLRRGAAPVNGVVLQLRKLGALA
jgi:hypothetical protein